MGNDGKFTLSWAAFIARTYYPVVIWRKEENAWALYKT